MAAVACCEKEVDSTNLPAVTCHICKRIFHVKCLSGAGKIRSAGAQQFVEIFTANRCFFVCSDKCTENEELFADAKETTNDDKLVRIQESMESMKETISVLTELVASSLLPPETELKSDGDNGSPEDAQDGIPWTEVIKRKNVRSRNIVSQTANAVVAQLEERQKEKEMEQKMKRTLVFQGVPACQPGSTEHDKQNADLEFVTNIMHVIGIDRQVQVQGTLRLNKRPSDSRPALLKVFLASEAEKKAVLGAKHHLKAEGVREMFANIYIRPSLPLETRIKRDVLFELASSTTFPGSKVVCAFNLRSEDYELHPLKAINGVDKVDWRTEIVVSTGQYQKAEESLKQKRGGNSMGAGTSGNG